MKNTENYFDTLKNFFEKNWKIILIIAIVLAIAITLTIFFTARKEKFVESDIQTTATQCLTCGDDAKKEDNSDEGLNFHLEIPQ